jgi:hypothetical protein
VLEVKSRRRTGKGGWRGSWQDRLDIPKAEETDILLTRGEYPNPEDLDENGEPRLAHFHTCNQHGVKLKPQGQGSYYSARCNIEAGQEDCLCCMRMQQGDRRITMKDVYSFNCLHLSLHERVPLVRDGKVVKYEDGDKRGEPVMTWSAVEKPRRRKEILDDIDGFVRDGEAALFRKKYIEVGPSHRDELSQIDEMASHYCKCEGELTPVLFTCEKCEEVLVDVEKDDMSKKEVESFASSREKCSCGHIGLPVPEMVCTSCKQPEPLTAFDVVATVKKEGAGTNAHIVVRKITPLTRYQLPNGTSLLEWEKSRNGEYDPRIDDNGDFVFTDEYDVRKAAEAQFDFEKVHEPRDHGYHANRLGCENPFRNAGASKYKNYGGGNGRTRVDDEPARGRGRGRDDDDDEPEEQEERGRGRGRGRSDEDDGPPRRQRVGSR